MPQTVFVTYEYAHRNTLQSGIEFCINQNYNDKFFVGLGYGIGIEAGKKFGFPTAHLKFNSKEGYLCQLGFTNAKITTSTGITLYNAIDLQLGYSFPFHNESLPQLKGITFGITVRFSKNKKVFGSMKWF